MKSSRADVERAHGRGDFIIDGMDGQRRAADGWESHAAQIHESARFEQIVDCRWAGDGGSASV